MHSKVSAGYAIAVPCLAWCAVQRARVKRRVEITTFGTEVAPTRVRRPYVGRSSTAKLTFESGLALSG
jgi:hypothetical protein